MNMVDDTLWLATVCAPCRPKPVPHVVHGLLEPCVSLRQVVQLMMHSDFC